MANGGWRHPPTTAPANIIRFGGCIGVLSSSAGPDHQAPERTGRLRPFARLVLGEASEIGTAFRIAASEAVSTVAAGTEPNVIAHRLSDQTGAVSHSRSLSRRAPSVALHLVRGTRALAAAGLLQPLRPDTVARTALAVIHDGLSPAAGYAYGAARFPRRLAVVDEDGALTYAQMDRRIAAIAGALAGAGVGPADRVALLCRNHRDFVLVTAAASSLGADIVLLSSAATAPEVETALRGQHVTVVVHDPDLAAQAAGTGFAAGVRRIATTGSSAGLDPNVPGCATTAPADRSHDDAGSATTALDDLPRAPRSRLRLAPRPGSRYVLLTSGTTGVPRGAARRATLSLDPVVAVLSRIPLHVGDVTLIAPPLFHAWGFANLALAVGMTSTVVLRRRFDPEAMLAAIAQHRVRVLVAVPAMLVGLAALPEHVRGRYDTSSLRLVASSGSALPGDLALRFMDIFGDILYNVYGSTEAAWASIATPDELRRAPHCAGRPPLGTDLRLVDAEGHTAAPGDQGRILVRNALTAGDFVATGDLGHIDESGLLHVDGREDDMIVSGGENIHPQEVEDVLLAHPAVAEVAVVGRPDPTYGQRVHACVVATPGANPSSTELRAFASERLARYKVPRSIELVASLPRTATGKPLRRLLQDPDHL